MSPEDDPTGPPSDPAKFYDDLAAFHEQRGTTLDANARVNGKHIDLFKLFEVVNQRGGYDVVSSEKLAWRKVGQEFNLGQTNTAAYAFALKTVYYKNLAAYAIKRVHKQDPPPKEILEEVSAKGGELLTRTLENFRPPQSREQIVNGNDSDGSGEDEGRTPKEEKMDVDDPGSGGGRTSRGLRQAPPQRVLFQPDISSSRQIRHTPNHTQSPQPLTSSAHNAYAYNPSSNPNSTSFNLANYEPRPQIPLTLRPVITPGNNPTIFKDRIKKLREAQAAKLGKTPPSYRGMMLPGTGFDGPNIYVRTLLALRSGISQEQDYALHHLVKISHERGDKYKFEAFPGLAEGLIEKALEVGSLFYNVKWQISYADNGPSPDNYILDGMNGTTDLLERIGKLQRLDNTDDIETEEFTHKLLKVNEAGLVIRNMSMLEDNARYLSEQQPIRDLLTIILNLPRKSTLVELKHYALDVAEQLTKYWSLESTDVLYISLLKHLNEGLDRGAALTTLRAISRISMNLEDSNRLENVPLAAILRLSEWTLLDDEELVAACLDFFYQFTAVPENVAVLLSQDAEAKLIIQPLITQLGRLLLHNVLETSSKRMISAAIPAQPAAEVPTIPADLLEQVLKHSEPERSSQWLRACFQEDAESDITQIALWQAYQSCFTRYSSPQQPLLVAAEFIKNVSTTFPTANAQVISGPSPKFIIKGIRPRHIPADTKGRAYSRCLWKPPGSPNVCGEFFLNPANMWEHLVSTHLTLTRDSENHWNFDEAQIALGHNHQKLDCYWAGCQHFAANGGTESLYDVGMHVKTHLPDTSAAAAQRAKYNKSSVVSKPNGNADTDDIPDDYSLGGQPATYEHFPWYHTAMDERGEAAGLPLTSVLVLRNLARNIPRAVPVLEDMNGGTKKADGEHGWVNQLFGPIKSKLWHVFAHNRSLSSYVWDLMVTVEKGIEG